MKKALILASVASMIDQFNMQNIQLLLDEGYDVDVIANFKQGNTISEERIKELKQRLDEMNVSVYDVPIPRKISDFKGILQSYRKVKKQCDKRAYTLVHCHSPIGGVIARLAARNSREKGTKVIYTAHGFHFYKGAPLKNWLIFYPIEKACARWTDVLITINKEDFTFAKQHMKAHRVEYIPGVGIDTAKFQIENFDKDNKKKELGLTQDTFVLLSVGELNVNKNHEVVIKALAQISNPNIHYCIAGHGEREQYLIDLATSLEVEKQLHLLGYRTDIPELYNMANVFVFPSFREGLSVSLMEAMASGLPCVASDIRGNVDLIVPKQGGVLFTPDNVSELTAAISNLLHSQELERAMGDYNQQIIVQFDSSKVNEEMRNIYF